MATWHQLTLSDPDAALAASNRMQSAFFAYATSVGGKVPSGFGIFSTLDDDSGQVFWYFSPDAERLANSFGAKLCEKPEPNRLFALLVGNQESAMLHFPAKFGRHRRD